MAVSRGHQGLLDLAATATATGLTFYHRGLTGSQFHLGETAIRQLETMLVAQQQDAHQVRALGGRVLVQEVLLPVSMHRDASVFVQTGLHLEGVSVQLYLSATRDLAAHNQPEVTLLLARLAVCAAQRRMQLSHLAGLSGEEVALGPVAQSTSEALRPLAAYLGRPRNGFERVAVFS